MRIALEIPPDTGSVGLARHLAAQVARQAGFDDDRIDDIRVTVTELVSNAVEEHARRRIDERVRVELVCALPFEVAVADRGGGIDPQMGAAAPAGALDRDGGLGLVIVRALADELLIEPRPGGGTIVTAVVQTAPATRSHSQ